MAGNAIATAYVQLIPTTDGISSRIRDEFSDAGSEANKGFAKNFALGGAIAGAVSAVTTQVISSMQDLATQAVIASDSTDKFKSTLNFAGLDTKEIEAVSKSTRAYADATVYDLATIQNTTAQLAANGVPNYEKLVEAAGNLNSVAGGNADTFKSVGMVLSQTAGAGKLTTENWNQLADAIPGASGVIQAALEKNGAFTGNFRDAMAEGQITSEEFNAALMELGNDPVAVEAAKSTDTFEGALGNLQATITGGLADALNQMKPMITDAIGGLSEILTGIGDAMKWMSDNANLSIPIIAALGTVLLAALAPSIWAAVVATWAFTVALLANPITWIILAIGALIGVIVFLAMNWDSVVKWISNVWSGFISWITPGIKAIGDVFSNIFNGIGKVVSSVFEGIVWVIKTYINSILKLVNGVIDALNGVGSFISKATGGTIGFKLGKIPLLAQGGTITGSGTVLVGEKGPELLNLNRGASVVPLDKASGQTIVYHAAPNQSLDAEQALFTAMRRAKVVGW